MTGDTVVFRNVPALPPAGADAEVFRDAPARPRARADAGLSIVIPVFNEEEGLPALHDRVSEVARRLKDTRRLAVEVIYVDDGSLDTTLATARALPADVLDVQVVSLSRNFGKEAALLAGLDHARCGASATTWSTPPRPTARTSRGCGASPSKVSIR
jgi:hypothetical protein